MSGHKVAVVTGGSGGIGNAICRRLLSDSYNVYILSRDSAKGNSAADSLNGLKLPGNVSFQNCDVSSEVSILEAIQHLRQRENHVDLLVNGAGILHRSPIANTESKSASDQINTMLLGTILMTSAMLPLLSASGNSNVINISSVAGRQSYPGLAVYGAAKAGIIHFTRTSARELLRQGIRVNCICPGIVDTPLQSASELLWLKSLSPKNRIQKPEEIADFLIEILRFDSLTGAVIDLDDGVGLFAEAGKMPATLNAGETPSVSTSGVTVALTNDSTAQDLTGVFTRVFNVNASQIQGDSGPDDIVRWDSVGHLRLISDLEKTFERQFNVDEVMQMTNFNAILKILKKT